MAETLTLPAEIDRKRKLFTILLDPGALPGLFFSRNAEI